MRRSQENTDEGSPNRNMIADEAIKQLEDQFDLIFF
jgi:hypothetical protein